MEAGLQYGGVSLPNVIDSPASRSWLVYIRNGIEASVARDGPQGRRVGGTPFESPDLSGVLALR
jgi:hypothetical protein